MFSIVILAVLIAMAGVLLWVNLQRPAMDRAQDGAVKERDSNVFYEIFVRSFYDSDGDGIGDLNGVTAKLDYLQELGVSGIWLTPIHPSPSYHGYDVTDYYDIHPDFGTMEDFDTLLDEAHRRKIKVIIDLVVNHSSSKHPWFIEAAKGIDNPYRNWYVWADEDTHLQAASAIGGRAWHPTHQGHYLGIFWEGMPDLNLDHPDVRAEFTKIGQFWLEKGVDGFRLDAAKHVFEDLAGDQRRTELAEKNVAWWQEFRKGLNRVNPDAYLVGEIWDTSAVIGTYLDHALNAGFNFELAEKLIHTARTESASHIASSLKRIYTYYDRISGGTFDDAPFLTNHDQNRVMSQLNGNEDHAKMAAALLLTLPGTPYIYYGEEIGMQGVKPDEYIREPMLWNQADSDAPASVELQENMPDSLLNHYKKLIHWRKMEPILADGEIDDYRIDNGRIEAFIRRNDTGEVLVLHNLSQEQQELTIEPSSSFQTLILSTTDEIKLSRGTISMPPYSSAVLK